jgi:glycosyltransferase involved in cell wall biosynthesis
MKILFTTPLLEHPPAGGPQLRIENSIIALNRVSDLHVLSRVEKKSLGGDAADNFFCGHCREFVYLPSITGLSDNRYVRKCQRISRKLLSSQLFENDIDFIIDYTEKKNIDILWFGYGNISYPLIKEIKRKRPSLKVVCDTDSVWSRFILRELPYENDPVRRKKIEQDGALKEQEEREWVNLCDVTTAVSEVDAKYYRKIANEPERIKIFSNVINLDTYLQKIAPPADFKNPCFYIAGSFWPKSPMEKATRWVIKEVLPIIKEVIPEVHFYIIGRGSTETLYDIKDSCITITGMLPSVLPYLCNADVSIVPLTFESGTRFKILEAATCGIPIVSTTLGAEGIPVADGVHILIADDPFDFAQAIIKLLNDRNLASQLAQNCHQIVTEHYSVESLSCEAEIILDYLTNHSNR